MSFADEPEVNPYAAPVADVGRPFDRGVGVAPEYASFSARFAAVFLDGLILGAVNFAIGLAIGFLLLASGSNPSAVGPQALLNLLGLVIGVGYNAGMISSSSQATLGKMALGIKVTDLQGRRISLGRAIGRELAKILSAMILLIGYIMAAFTARKQALHDMIAGTLVLKAR